MPLTGSFKCFNLSADKNSLKLVLDKISCLQGNSFVMINKKDKLIRNYFKKVFKRAQIWKIEITKLKMQHYSLSKLLNSQYQRNRQGEK